MGDPFEKIVHLAFRPKSDFFFGTQIIQMNTDIKQLTNLYKPAWRIMVLIIEFMPTSKNIKAGLHYYMQPACPAYYLSIFYKLF